MRQSHNYFSGRASKFSILEAREGRVNGGSANYSYDSFPTNFMPKAPRFFEIGTLFFIQSEVDILQREKMYQ